MSPQFARFLAVGSVAAAVNIGTCWLLHLVLNYEASILIAYAVAMTTGYVLNRAFVFDRSGRHAGGEYIRFGIVNLVALVQVWGVSELLARMVFPHFGFTWHADTIAHAIGVASPTFSSYFGHKHFSFAAKASNEP